MNVEDEQAASIHRTLSRAAFQWSREMGVVISPGAADYMRRHHKTLQDEPCDIGCEADYESIPDERWADVTKDCRWQEGWNELIYRYPNGRDERISSPSHCKNYRINKCNDDGFYFFRIEKKVAE